MQRLRVAVSVFLACVAFSVSALEEQPVPNRNSPFLRELYQRPLPSDYRGILLAASVLGLARQNDDGTKLDRFAKRKALKTFLGEPFEFSGTTEAAIVREAAESEPYETLRSRALAAVSVRYAPPGTKIAKPPADFKDAGNSIWVNTELSRVTVYMPLVVGNDLKEPVKEVGIQVGKTESGKPVPYYLFLTCRPEDKGIFAPGTSKLAVCSGYESPQGMDLAIEAFRKRAIPAPMPAYSIRVATDDTVIATRLMRFHDEVTPYAKEAKQILAEKTCHDLGTCGEIERRAEAKQRDENRPWNFLLVVAACVAVLGLAVRAMKPREAKGWFAPLIATVLIASSIVAIFCTLGILRSRGGWDGIVEFVVLFYMAIPHFIIVLIVAASLAGGGLTRFRVFALGMGLLAPAMVWVGLNYFAKSAANA